MVQKFEKGSEQIQTILDRLRTQFRREFSEDLSDDVLAEWTRQKILERQIGFLRDRFGDLKNPELNTLLSLADGPKKVKKKKKAPEGESIANE